MQTPLRPTRQSTRLPTPLQLKIISMIRSMHYNQVLADVQWVGVFRPRNYNGHIRSCVRDLNMSRRIAQFVPARQYPETEHRNFGQNSCAFF